MRRHVICHMLSSVDGRIDGRALDAVTGEGEYEATGATLNGDAWDAITYHVFVSRRRQRETKPD